MVSWCFSVAGPEHQNQKCIWDVTCVKCRNYFGALGAQRGLPFDLGIHEFETMLNGLDI